MAPYYILCLLLFCTTTVQASVDEQLQMSCDQSFYISESEVGVIHTYNYPFNYQNKLNCTYYIFVNSYEHVEQVSSQTNNVTQNSHDVTLHTDGSRNDSAGVNVRHGTNEFVCFRFYRFDSEKQFDILSIEEGGAIFKYEGRGESGLNYSAANRDNVWVDDFCFQTTQNLLKLKFTSDESYQHLGFYATFWTQPKIFSTSDWTSDAKDPSRDSTAPCFGENEWTCFNRACIDDDKLCDTSDACGDWSDESYAHARCLVDDVITYPGVKGPGIYSCDFRDGNGCGFIGLANPGWYLQSNSLGSSDPEPDPDRRPVGDHTVGPSWFESFYVRTIFGEVTGDTRLGLTDTRVWLDPNITYCLSFWYHMMGPRVGRLRVSLQPELERPLWSRTANYSARWLHGEVLINHLTNHGQIFFDAFRSHDNLATFALDDISLAQDKPCYTDDISCTFEFHFCGWKNYDGGFKRINHKLDFGGPHSDPISINKEEYYVALKTDTATSATLVSPVWGGHVHGSDEYRACLQAWFFSSTTQHGEFKIWTEDLSGRRHVKNIGPYMSNNGEWREILIDVHASTPFKIEIEGTAYVAGTQLAFDEVVVIPGSCQHVELQSCDLAKFMCTQSGACIEEFRMCDGYRDCSDGSDEDTLACCHMGGCAQGHFCCSNQNCLWNLTTVCDGKNDCGDWSDEKDCECDVNMFQCEELQVCIPASYQCDGVEHCPSGSDEHNCCCYFPPAAITSIVVVGVIIIIVVIVRAVMCARKRPQCRRLCPCNSENTSEIDVTPDIEGIENGPYQLPPEYQECVNNPLYRKPTRDKSGSIEVADQDAISVTLPSYDQVEKGQYETTDVQDAVALARLREQIMTKSREALDTSQNDSRSTIGGVIGVESVYAEISDPPRRSVADQEAELGVINASFCASVEDIRVNGLNSGGVVVQTHVARGQDNQRTARGQGHQFPARTGQRDAPVSVSRVGSNVSKLSIPKYADLIHPPAYDNLYFCDDNPHDGATTGVRATPYGSMEHTSVNRMLGLQGENSSPETGTRDTSLQRRTRKSNSNAVVTGPTSPSSASAGISMSTTGSDTVVRGTGPQPHTRHSKTSRGHGVHRRESDRLKASIRQHQLMMEGRRDNTTASSQTPKTDVLPASDRLQSTSSSQLHLNELNRRSRAVATTQSGRHSIANIPFELHIHEPSMSLNHASNTRPPTHNVHSRVKSMANLSRSLPSLLPERGRTGAFGEIILDPSSLRSSAEARRVGPSAEASRVGLTTRNANLSVSLESLRQARNRESSV